jgi:hypothetical protein
MIRKIAKNQNHLKRGMPRHRLRKRRRSRRRAKKSLKNRSRQKPSHRRRVNLSKRK